MTQEGPESVLRAASYHEARIINTTSASVYRARHTQAKRSARNDLRRKNTSLRDKIHEVLEEHPELQDMTEEIALRQDLHVQVGTPFLERTQGKLQERAKGIIERRPELEHSFDDSPRN
jgi:predicted nuclease with TOPRIM domain